MNSYSTSSVVASTVQDLFDTGCVYDSTTGVGTLTLTRPMAATSARHIAVSSTEAQGVLWAYGATVDMMRHRSRGAALITLGEGAGIVSAPAAATGGTAAGSTTDRPVDGNLGAHQTNRPTSPTDNNGGLSSTSSTVSSAADAPAANNGDQATDNDTNDAASTGSASHSVVSVAFQLLLMSGLALLVS
eukprot:TRINITY_DN1959_c0_g1_i4.p1 TRINITY_DN1959_c0_g1~~TRINITY_DN1959_c0_g1_i4.p1  ORF type:complete len:188 (-),score=24.13 TRINITY_DN1959_c0_g1_i4:297-860(-)